MSAREKKKGKEMRSERNTKRSSKKRTSEGHMHACAPCFPSLLSLSTLRIHLP
jgi:hypothetical protein